LDFQFSFPEYSAVVFGIVLSAPCARGPLHFEAIISPLSSRASVDDKRASPRRRVLKSAFIVLGEKAPKLECAVKNISETGAMLKVSTTLGIPHNFDLIVEGEKHHCRSVWRTETNIGVAFKR
jgi:hypothetical protein